MSLPITNIAAYHFTDLTELPLWRERVLNQATELELKGTVLLAHEGINLFLAGAKPAIESFLVWLRSCEPFASLKVKYSVSEAVPFKRMKVKIKNEIIRMNHPAIHPAAGRAPGVDPVTARRWIEQGHDDQGRDCGCDAISTLGSELKDCPPQIGQIRNVSLTLLPHDAQYLFIISQSADSKALYGWSKAR
jgi:acylphosphatase